MRYYVNGNDWKCKDYLGEDWVWRHGEKIETTDLRWWRSATVPGTVARDVWQAGEISDPYFGRNSLLMEWIPERTWIYRKVFTLPTITSRRWRLCFKGVDYEALIYLNNQFLGSHKGMFSPFSFDVTDYLVAEGENLLSVVIQKAPDEQPQVSKTSYVKTHKSRMTYWWDFCPRMIHQGIWDDVYLEDFGSALIESVFIRPKLIDQYRKAELHIKAEITTLRAQEGEVELILTRGSKLLRQEHYFLPLEVGTKEYSFCLELLNPELWWPNGYGEQPIYSLETRVSFPHEAIMAHFRQDSFGIREVEWTTNAEAESTAAPYCLLVNKTPIYIKGWNWVPMDVMYGVDQPEKLNHLLELAKDAHVNFLRVWGGGLIEKKAFYDICDRLGILVWQEFIQSSSGIDNQPPVDSDFLTLLECEAEAIIPRLRNHPSLALWCGGNELQSAMGAMISDQEPAIKRLRRVLLDLDPDRRFLASSPAGRIFNNTLENIQKDPKGLHDVHGPWEHQGLTEQYTLYNQGTSLLSSEFGVEGMAYLNTLKATIPENQLWPPSRDNPVYFHRGSWWNNFPFVSASFSQEDLTLEKTIKASQFLQYEGLRYGVEANRRRAFACGGTFMWQFNEPYPNAYCTSSVDYYGQPKPAYYGTSKAYAPVMVTAAFESQILQQSACLEAVIFGHSSVGLGHYSLNYRLLSAEGDVYRNETLAISLEKESQKLAELSFPLHQTKGELLLLDIRLSDRQGELIAENSYIFSCGEDLSALFSLQGELSVKQLGETIFLTNSGKTLLTGITLCEENAVHKPSYTRWSDNYINLLPGETKKITLTSTTDANGTWRIDAFGLAEPYFFDMI